MTTTMTITTWLLGGALAASLGWNALTLRRPATHADACGDSGGCIAAVERLERSGGLDLSSDQRATLLALLHECDAQGARSDAQAAEVAREVQAMLRDPAADPAAIALRAKELGAIRAAAIEHCIQSSLALRKLLTPVQMGQLLDACCGGSCGEACGTGR